MRALFGAPYVEGLAVSVSIATAESLWGTV
jgi:hypothetical protein